MNAEANGQDHGQEDDHDELTCPACRAIREAYQWPGWVACPGCPEFGIRGIDRIGVIAHAHEVTIYAFDGDPPSLATIRLTIPFAQQLARMLTVLTDAATSGQLGATTSLEANIIPRLAEADEDLPFEDEPEEEINS
jgi:hypothetical protein